MTRQVINYLSGIPKFKGKTLNFILEVLGKRVNYTFLRCGNFFGGHHLGGEAAAG